MTCILGLLLALLFDGATLAVLIEDKLAFFTSRRHILDNAWALLLVNVVDSSF
ncbi:hypothetical protein BT63DRAFT_429251 [Microthyrium microscopicum]|uniref:Uncharacterized protein n=1 Tax=Microthyrium microscopicum TaxID=703497 RepID=A0A6A6TYI9_9PEZI|nr:hypothetical protein BT63DRAFT_429251 [Microthyrium microscopicum]